MALAKRKVVRKAKQGKSIRQVAAVPVRWRDGKPEILLVTSRTTKRFIVPKGWPMKGKSARQAALIEAREEAGVIGVTRKEPLGAYRYWKRLSDAFVLIEVVAYLLNVESTVDEWDESPERQRAWLAPGDAASLVDEPELASLIRAIGESDPA